MNEKLSRENLIKRFVKYGDVKDSRNYNKKGELYAIYMIPTTDEGYIAILKTYKTKAGAEKYMKECRNRTKGDIKYRKITTKDVFDNGGWLL